MGLVLAPLEVGERFPAWETLGFLQRVRRGDLAPSWPMASLDNG